ncbi:DUF2812 domain-containing protein [Clostridia bacterium]|nr:DUF2812 domain-containing protein [Clostridia bacterium]
MGKMVRKLLLDDIYAVGRNESWFSDMSKKGLHLTKIGGLFVYFEKGEPKDVRYRIEVLMDKPNQERIDLYEQCGWDLVTRTGKFYIFIAEKSDKIRELHTDPVEQGHTLDELDKLLKRNVLVFSIALVLMFGLILGPYFLLDEPVLLMVRGQFLQQVLLLVVEIYVFFRTIRNYLSIRNLKESLLQGNPATHYEGYKQARFFGGIVALFYVLIALAIIPLPIVSMNRSIEYNLPEDTDSLPFVRLAEIEESPNLEREIGTYYREVDRKNRVQSDWSLMAPIQYEIDEHGIVSGEMWADQSGEYSPSIENQFFKLTFAGLSEGLTEDLIQRYVWEPEAEIIALPYPGMDKMFIAEDGIRKQIFAYSGKKVMHVTYYGNTNIEKIIPLVAEQVIRFKG